MSICKKPDCDCAEIAMMKAGHEVKEYPCLATNGNYNQIKSMSQLPKEKQDLENKMFHVIDTECIGDFSGRLQAAKGCAEAAALHYSQVIEEKDKEIGRLENKFVQAAISDLENEKKLQSEIEGLKAENEEWKELKKIAIAKKWIEMYADYQDILTKQDVASWWQSQFDIANAERSKLQSQIKGLVEGITKAKSKARVFEDEEYNAHDILHETLTNYYNSIK